MKELFTRFGVINPHEERERSHHVVELASSPELLTLAEGLKTSSPDWDLLIDQLLETQKPSRIPNLHGRLAELYVKHALAQQATALGEDITINPFMIGRTGNFSLLTKPNGTTGVTNFWTRQTITDYDLVTEIQGLPAVWEVKSGLNPSSFRKNDTSGSLKAFLKSENIDRKLKPLTEYYNSRKIGYVIVLAKEVFLRHITGPGYTIENFHQRGGTVTHLPFERDELDEAAECAASRLQAIR